MGNGRAKKIVANNRVARILRYPGGKGWFVKYAEQFLVGHRPRLFLEPFAGGATVGLTLLLRDRIDHLMLVELHPRVAAFWRRVLDDPKFADEVLAFDCTRENVERLVSNPAPDNLAMWTLVKNRCSWGGHIETKVGLLKVGDHGRGVAARWKPDVLAENLRTIYDMRGRITFVEGDGVQILRNGIGLEGAEQCAAFIDPPYTLARDGAGHQLYIKSRLDHQKLFDVLKEWPGRFVATYDESQGIRDICLAHGLAIREVPMHTAHHTRKLELVIGKDLGWLQLLKPLVLPSEVALELPLGEALATTSA